MVLSPTENLTYIRTQIVKFVDPVTYSSYISYLRNIQGSKELLLLSLLSFEGRSCVSLSESYIFIKQVYDVKVVKKTGDKKD
jgi:hypothetical protein